jgi:hypothetical protein
MKIASKMAAFRMTLSTRLVFCCALAVPLPAWQAANPAVRRIYVEPFTTKAGSETLRADLLGELRKQNSLSLAPSEPTADVILGGGGEIWIKGYRSLNPRSGRLPSDGTPVYAGYLSVELRNTRGETIWSYLVTPGTGSSEDVAKDLAKRIARHLLEALKQNEAPPRTAALPQPAILLKAAGATFPYPVYAKWFTNYRRENPTVQIVYDPIGSEAGVRALLAGGADFGASDSPEAIHQFVPQEEAKYLLFPSVVGAVVPIVNLPGFSNTIAFTPEALSGIYLGKIKKWNDPVLRQANRGLQLPDLDIVVVHRADGSGTSYAWTDFCRRPSPSGKLKSARSWLPGGPSDGRPREMTAWPAW